MISHKGGGVSKMWINSRKTFAKSNEDRKNTARRWSLLSGKISEYLLPHNVLLTEYTVVEATDMLHSWAVWSSALHLKHQLTILIISWSDLISADNSDHQLDQSVYQLIRPYIRWSVEWTSWTITSCIHVSLQPCFHHSWLFLEFSQHGSTHALDLTSWWS